MHRITYVRANGAAETIDGLTYQQAETLFYAATKYDARDDYAFVGIFELGFVGTSDAQWVIINAWSAAHD